MPKSMDVFNNKRINHWREFRKLRIDDITLSKIEEKQKSLFYEEVRSRINMELYKIKELDSETKKKYIVNTLNLIDSFLKGDTSAATVRRLKNIIRFDSSEKVLVAYDELLSDKLILHDYNVYSESSYCNSPALAAAFFTKYFERLSEEVKVLHINNKPEIKPKTKHQSFTYKKWQFDPTNLTYLKESLIDKKLIASNTELKHFRKAFSGEEIEKPIVWTGNISELSYFIKQLHNKLKLVENLKQKQWEVTTICFVQEDGSPFDRYKFKGQKVPATSKNIDTALKTL